ncbi:LOW QUALITY PROTEIN: hypothetical protein Dda_3154 [Drechslerella dactyloides]|uniref:Uncharacterized protein n=1 Tax=Drechslerella dactyloides TaxID=74499 RepID=A0AAD6J5B5_DREDA|nr:LOW QUALITY PROTEIN: hypothetical protein Dda_3154 [Drechslerella dactyloides]
MSNNARETKTDPGGASTGTGQTQVRRGGAMLKAEEDGPWIEGRGRRKALQGNSEKTTMSGRGIYS